MKLFKLNPEDLQSYGGEVIYHNINIDIDMDIDKQLEELQEDLIQIRLPQKLVLDVGWYPSEDIQGSFQVMLIKEHDWDSPIYLEKTNDIKKLKKVIQNVLSATSNFRTSGSGDD